MRKFFSSKANLILIGLFLLGFAFRNLYTNKLAINFMFDQARDFYFVKDILNGDFKIQGLPANAPGLYHGVLFLYFLVIPNLLGGSNLTIPYIWLSFFSSFTIIIVYFLCFYLTRDRRASFLSSLFFTFSFEASQYALWLSNPAMAVWFVPLMYLSLWLWTIKNKKVFSFLTGLFLGLSIQSDLFLIYHVFPIIIWTFLNRNNVKLQEIFKSIFGLLVGVSTLIISEIKFGFHGIQGLEYLLTGGDKIASSKTFFDFVEIYFNQLLNIFNLNLIPISLIMGKVFTVLLLLFLLLSLFRSKKRKSSHQLFLLLFLTSHIWLFYLGGLNTPYIAVGIGSAVCILMAIFLSELYQKNKILTILLIGLIIYSNIITIVNKNKLGQTIFAVRPQMLLSNLLQAIDYTYTSSDGENFSINTVTAPLWLNTTWSALYNQYGYKKHGYLPYWHGRDQVGYWGDNLKKTPKEIKVYYLIIEPSGGIPIKYIKESIDDENSKSKIIEEKTFDGITVQKREKIR